MAFAISKITACVCVFCAAEMAGELIRNLSENLPIKRACPRLWCRPGKAAYGNADGNRPDYKTKADPVMCRVGFIIGRMRHCAPARRGEGRGANGKKKGSRYNREPEFSGGPSGTRTPNQLIKSQLLYQLS